MIKRVTKEIAQQRVNAIGRELTILEWSTTNKPCKIKCNKCGTISEVKLGCYVYKESNGYFMWYDCTGCMINEKKLKKDLLEKKKAEDRKRYHSYLVKEGQVIEDRIELAKEELKKYINKEVAASDLVEDISKVLGIEKMSFVRFNFSVLDRIADYDMINLNKFGKKGYIVKDVHNLVLPKTKERIELEERIKGKN